MSMKKSTDTDTKCAFCLLNACNETAHPRRKARLMFVELLLDCVKQSSKRAFVQSFGA